MGDGRDPGNTSPLLTACRHSVDPLPLVEALLRCLPALHGRQTLASDGACCRGLRRGGAAGC